MQSRGEMFAWCRGPARVLHKSIDIPTLALPPIDTKHAEPEKGGECGDWGYPTSVIPPGCRPIYTPCM